MKKKILFISRSFVNDSPVGTRHLNYIKHLNSCTDLTVLNLTKKTKLHSVNSLLGRLINKSIRKLPLLPDSDILIINSYKKNIRSLLEKNYFDAVLIGVLPFSFLYLAKYIKHIRPDLKVILDMTDPISAHISFSLNRGFRYKFMINFENKYLKFVDILVVLNEEIRQYYYTRCNKLNYIIVIEQGLEENLIYKYNKTNLNTENVKLIYAGQFYKNHREPFELYKAIEKVNYKVKLLVFGSFKRRFSPPKSNSFIFGGRISRKILKFKYRDAHIIVFIDNKDSIQVPGKTLEILSLNKPILFIYYNEKSPTLKYVKKFEGIYLTKNSFKDIQKTIERIIKKKVFYYERDLSTFYWKNLLKRFNEILDVYCD